MAVACLGKLKKKKTAKYIFFLSKNKFTVVKVKLEQL